MTPIARSQVRHGGDSRECHRAIGRNSHRGLAVFIVKQKRSELVRPHRDHVRLRASTASFGETLGVLACFLAAGMFISIGWVLSATDVLAF
jgi:hypothetical protein